MRQRGNIAQAIKIHPGDRERDSTAIRKVHSPVAGDFAQPTFVIQQRMAEMKALLTEFAEKKYPGDPEAQDELQRQIIQQEIEVSLKEMLAFCKGTPDINLENFDIIAPEALSTLEWLDILSVPGYYGKSWKSHVGYCFHELPEHCELYGHNRIVVYWRDRDKPTDGEIFHAFKEQKKEEMAYEAEERAKE